MMKLQLVCIAILAAGMASLDALEPLAAQESSSSVSVSAEVPSGLKLETLMTTRLEGIDGTDVIVSRVIMPPNSTLPKHWHPGEEFAYVLSGSTTLYLEGQGPVTFGPGEIGKVPLKRVHSASAGEEGATILVFRIHEHGQPERVLVD